MSPVLLLAVVASAQPAMPTQGLLRIENFDCISSQIPIDRAQAYYAMMRKGTEIEAFEAEPHVTEACQVKHGWSDIQARNAFRVSLMDGWLLAEGLIENIQSLGDFKPWLDRYYEDNVGATGRQILEDVFLSGKMDRDLDAVGYPGDKKQREWVYDYFEWRGALRGIEDDFRFGELRQ
ncbi:hypothetical protein [Parasphingorhabdus sp. NYA22]